jgi:hypothetical protein
MKRVFSVLCIFAVVGCVRAAPPLPTEQRIAQAPRKGEITLASKATAPVGQVVPIDVNFANGTDARFKIDTTQVFAINEKGERVAPVPLSEAIRLSGDAIALNAQVKSGLITGLAGAALGAAVGSAMGSTSGSAGSGAIVGGALGAGVGGIGGAASAGEEANRSAASQLAVLALRDRWVEPGYSVNGYVFYPPGTYKGVEALVKGEEGELETLKAKLQ